MIDELDLVFDEHGDRGRHRGRHTASSRRRSRKSRRRGRSLVAALLTIALLGTLGGLAWFGYDRLSGFFITPDYVTAGGTEKVTVEIKPGSTLLDMARALKAADVVKSEKAFIEAAEANGKARGIQPGFYAVPTKISGVDAVLALLDLANRVIKGVTINEGWTTFKIYKELSKRLGIPVEDFEDAAKDPIALGVPDWWFNRTDGKKRVQSLEGFLFPATYEFPPDVTAEGALKMMVKQFLQETEKIDFVSRVQNERKISPYEALIVASLAQAEAGNEEDLGKVARVAYNRAYGKMIPCGCLQFDVTVNYSREAAGKDPKPSSGLTDDELNDPKNPYNRLVKGLVPTPINNPGKTALQGAMDPPKGDWVYFVAIDKQGHSAFSASWEQFCRDNDKAVEAGVLKRSSC